MPSDGCIQQCPVMVKDCSCSRFPVHRSSNIELVMVCKSIVKDMVWVKDSLVRQNVYVKFLPGKGTAN